ncbi:MAG: ISNCY family transposase [Thermomicrobiales bacterium]
MLIDRHPYEDVFARVPELAGQTDPVLRHLDRLLDDDVLYTRVRADLATRYPRTLVHGRHSTPVEVLLRLMLVKHLYRWSYRETEARVADSLVLRWFCHVYFWPVPDATTLLRWAHTIQPATLHALNDRVVQLALQSRVTSGRKLRIDGTAVQTVIHHPTDSSLLADGVRVLSRLIRRSKPVVQEACAGVRDAFRTRMRTMRGGLQTLHRLRRRTGDDQTARRVAVYTKLVAATRATVTQAQRVRAALQDVAPRMRKQAVRLQSAIARYVPLVERVIRQTERRVFMGESVPATEKLVSLFEPHTRIVPRHKGGAAVEFGRLVVVDEVEGGIVTRFAVLADKTGEQGQLAPALAQHRRLFGKVPRLVTGDRGVHAAENEAVARAAGVRHLVIPRSGKLTAMQQADEQTRAWRRRYRWRAGIEGRLSSLRRDYGLRACPDHGEEGLIRRVGWGIIASNLRHIGQKLAA